MEYVYLLQNIEKMVKDTRHIAFLVLPNVTLLDVTGPYEVFSQGLESLSSCRTYYPFTYSLHTLSAIRSKTVRTASGLSIQCKDTIRSFDYSIDTLFIPGFPNSILSEYKVEKYILGWIKEQSLKVRRICSICTGTFLLAEAGILNGHKATSHWEVCDKLAHDYPEINVDSNPIFIKDGNVYTSAGISAGMDLALALLEEDFGRPLAIEVAKQMVLYLKRPGNQSQYSTVLTHQHADYRPIQEIESYIFEHLHEVLTVERLAEQSLMSVRNFARVFAKETGITPAKYIDKLRVETACRHLVDTQLSLKEIALACGLGSVDNMRKVFAKYIEISPGEYKRRFGND